jgi:serine protease Do
MLGLPFSVVLALAAAQSASAGQRSAAAQRAAALDFRDIADRVRPALVQVLTASEAVRGSSGLVAGSNGVGSGVIVDAEGYLVTNAHVVQGARRIQVVLAPAPAPDTRSVLRPPGRAMPARLVGMDLETDIAVLQIQEKGLSALPFADSETVRQGQLVLAFGSPLGLDQTLTMGVVSAVARQLRPDDPMIYLQTDASINPGNSGGPLVDLEGRVVGINAMIATQSGGSEGIGFAAPSNIVKSVFDQIRRTGRVRRSRIGARVQTITPTLARGLKLPRNYGVLVSDVVAGGAAARAGLQIGDVVTKLDGKPMENARQLEVNVYRQEPGKTIALEVLRAGSPAVAEITVEERIDDPSQFAMRVSAEKDRIDELGILCLDLDDEILPLLPALRARAGVLVAAVTADAPPSADPLLPGDVIFSVNNDGVSSRAGLRSALQAIAAGDPIVLQVERSGGLRYLGFEKE